jgi:hypothetical protein
VSHTLAWIPGGVFLGTALLLLIVPSFALIGLMVLALAALAALVALAGAMLAMPYLLLHSLRRRLAERRRPTGGSLPTAGVTAQTGSPTRQSGLRPSPKRRQQREHDESVGPPADSGENRMTRVRAPRRQRARASL